MTGQIGLTREEFENVLQRLVDEKLPSGTRIDLIGDTRINTTETEVLIWFAEVRVRIPR